MKTRFSVAVWSIVVAMGCAQSGQSSAQASVPQAQDAARGGIAVLQKLVTDQNYREMGFDSRDDVSRAGIGEPWSMFNIGLDQLKRYQPNADVNALLAPSADTIFPVTVNGQVKSSITVTKGEGGYKASSFGNAPVVKELSKHRQSAGSFVVRVPALNMYYVGSRVEGRLMLTPIIDDTRLKFQAGVAVPAEQLLEQLARIANDYNGLPM
jgi:hypothetical protein